MEFGGEEEDRVLAWQGRSERDAVTSKRGKSPTFVINVAVGWKGVGLQQGRRIGRCSIHVSLKLHVRDYCIGTYRRADTPRSNPLGSSEVGGPRQAAEPVRLVRLEELGAASERVRQVLRAH